MWFKPRLGSYNTTAYARFSNLESANKAVIALHNTKPDNLGGNIKLYVNKIISVRYSISTKIVDVLKPLLVEMGQDLQQNGYVRLKVRSRLSKTLKASYSPGKLWTQFFMQSRRLKRSWREALSRIARLPSGTIISHRQMHCTISATYVASIKSISTEIPVSTNLFYMAVQ